MFSSRIRPLRQFDQLLSIGDGARQFSACTPKRSDGFDEEDEDEIIISPDRSHTVRQRRKILEARDRQKREQEQALMRRREELQEWADRHANELRNAIALLQSVKQNFESIRRYVEDRTRFHEKWMKRYEQVITSSASLVNVGSQSLEEYFLIKYPVTGKIDSYINENAMFLQHFEAEVSNCSQALKRIGLASRRIDLETRLAHLEASLGSTAERLSNDHVTPVAAAKRKIENILEPLLGFHTQYIELQELGDKVKKSAREISYAIKKVAANRRVGVFRLEKFQENIMTGSYRITQKLHEYRANERTLRWGGPLGKTHVLTLIQNYYSDANIRMLASDIGMDPELLANEIDAHGISTLLVHWYLYRWKEGAPRSVDLDIAWRHLDIYHPFYMLSISYRTLSSEIFRISKFWKVTGDFRKEARFKEWKIEFDLMRQDYSKAIEMSSYCTWLRLETEDKVSRLGGVPDTIAKGLFTPKDPISPDLRRFFLFVDAVCDGLSRSMNRDQATVDLENSLLPTVSDAIELLDHSPSHKRSIDRSRPLAPKAATARKNFRVLEEETTQKQPLTLEQETQKQPLTLEEETTQEQPLTLEQETTQKATAIRSPTQIRVTRILQRLGRGYCTDSRASMNDDGQRCGVSEPEIALIERDQIAELENKNAATSLVSDVESPGIMSSSHISLDNSDEPLMVAIDDAKPQFWSYNQYKTPDGGKIGIHYCKNLEHAERAAALFSDSKLLGFDIEWKPQAQISAGIKSNVSLIQIANEERIALFHIALFKGSEIHDLVPPSLRKLLESTDTVKVGVSIKADCSRVRRHLDIDTRGQFELSHLYKLVKYGSTQPKLVDRRAVNLAQQVEELLGLPLKKDNDVRKSDWTKPLDYAQVQYAASDAYACVCLHRTLEAKRKALNPIPPFPAFAELNLPILLAEEDKVEVEEKVVELSEHMKESLEVVDAGEDVVEIRDETKKLDSA